MLENGSAGGTSSSMRAMVMAEPFEARASLEISVWRRKPFEAVLEMR